MHRRAATLRAVDHPVELPGDALATAVEDGERALREMSIEPGSVVGVLIEGDPELLAGIVVWRGPSRAGWPVAECFTRGRMPSFLLGRHEAIRGWRPGPKLALTVGCVAYLIEPVDAQP